MTEIITLSHFSYLSLNFDRKYFVRSFCGNPAKCPGRKQRGDLPYSRFKLEFVILPMVRNSHECRYDAQHNDIQHNVSQNDIQHNDRVYNETQHNNNQHNLTHLKMLTIMKLSIIFMIDQVSSPLYCLPDSRNTG